MDHNIIHISKGCIKCNVRFIIMIQTAAAAAHVYANNNKLMIVCIRYVSCFCVVVARVIINYSILHLLYRYVCPRAMNFIYATY